MTLFGVTVNINYMTIEKTFKLTIKDTAYFLTEQEVSALYEQCRQALNISATNPNWPTDDNTTTGNPQWPTYPLPNTYCGNVTCCTTTSGTTDNSVMDWHNYHGVTATGISTANVPSSKGINFISDDMETIKDNNNWRSSVQKALDKLSAKSNITTKLNSKTNITTNDGTKVG